MSAVAPMAPFSDYVTALSVTTSAVLGGRVPSSDPRVGQALDGQASAELRRLVSNETRRTHGAFFTSAGARERFAEAVRVHGKPPYFDPACGAGDLLLAAAQSLPAGVDAAATVTAFSRQLAGRDIAPSFVAAAKHRLLLAALARHDSPPAESVPRFRRLSIGDGTASRVLSRSQGTLLLNPPFGKQTAAPDCSWGSGSVSRAAVFFEQAVRRLSPGSTVIAILPDVIRSGSSLRRFRRMIETLVDVAEIVELGQFDAWTDIDVFLLVGHRVDSRAREIERSDLRSPAGRWVDISQPEIATLNDFFEVRVGPVVQSRDIEQGPEHPFVIASELPRSGAIKRICNLRRYGGRVFDPPFVLVRRTDRPSASGPRAVAVVVEDDRPVAVENHLLVLRPLDGSLQLCREAAEWLGTAEVRKFLDSRIRCRHLTTEALREIPAPQHWRSTAP